MKVSEGQLRALAAFPYWSICDWRNERDRHATWRNDEKAAAIKKPPRRPTKSEDEGD